MSELNAEQLAVVNCDAPRILCVASAGSGKSRVGVEWIKRRIDAGVHPSKIIAISFTNAASNVLQERLGSVRLGVNSTLHSFLLRLLQKHPSAIGLPERLSVIDDDAREGIIETIIEELGVKASTKKVMECLYDPRLIENARGSKTKIELVAVEYHRRLRASGLLDFFTVLYHGRRLIEVLAKERPELWPYTHCLWDEGQDGSDEDFKIFLAMPCAFKLMIGDPDQSIFGFRGAKPENIVNLALHKSAEMNNWKVFNLQTNYRCKRKICEAAQSLIEHNQDRIPKQTIANESGGTVVVEAFDNPGAELAFVAHELSRFHSRPDHADSASLTELRETAILCRTNPLVETFANYLTGLGIPVAKRKLPVVPADWSTAKLLLTVMANPYCDLAVHQFLVATKGKSADVYRRDAAKAMVSLYDHVREHLFAGQVVGLGNLQLQCLSHESRERIHDTCRLLPEGWTIPDLMFALKAGEVEAKEQGDGVHVSTIHGFKGREATTVYLVGFEDEFIPSHRKDADVAAERRLAYVGLTRARQRTVLTWCRARPENRGANVKPGPMTVRTPSRFIFEMRGEQPVYNQ